MPSDASGWLSLILAMGALASIAGVALIRANQTTLRESNADLRGQVADADAEVARIRAARAEDQAEYAKQHAADQARIAELESENAALGKVVTGEVHLVSLSTRLEDLIALVTALKEYVTRLLKESP